MASYNKTNLIVNYLPQSLSDEEFHTMFSEVGTVTASKIIRDRSTGYSHGYGFVDYATEEDAVNAIDHLNGMKLQHKSIKVAYSRQGENIKGANLYVQNLPMAATESDLQDIFSSYGNIVQTRVLINPSTGLSRGVGFVLLTTHEEAELAIKLLNGKKPPGFTQPMNVKFADENRKTQPNVTSLAIANMQSGNLALGFENGGSAFGNGFGGFGSGETGPIRNQIRARFNPLSGGASAYQNFGGVPTPSAGALAEKGFVLFVYNIGATADEYDLWQIFSPLGAVQKITVIRDSTNQKGKGYGFVTMVDYNAAVFAISKLNGYIFADNKPLQVSFKQ